MNVFVHKVHTSLGLFEGRDTEKLFTLTCRGGERGAKEALSGVITVSRFYLYMLKLSPKVSP